MRAGTPDQPQSGFTTLSSFLVIAFLLVALSACHKGTFSKAKGKASEPACQKQVGFVKGELDAGYDVIVTIRNVGQPGFIHIRPELSTSEGEWSRSQDVHFDAGESQTLTYFFDEPTINAGNIRCRVAISPSADD